ncbi:Potassium channel KOR1 [Cucurbita argyrosperma subsp. argyrosperma]|nr:Potassium channel KOR1 [Cucurbita argyrosperma subsp. argyrosperma]
MKSPVRFKLGKQSSLAPDGHLEDLEELVKQHQSEEGIDSRVRLMYLANEGDLEGINELLDSGVDVNFHDIDNRTALHIAACQGFADVVALLLERGAEVDSKDRWGSTPISNPTPKFGPLCRLDRSSYNILIVMDCVKSVAGKVGPLRDAVHYKNHDVIKLLEKHGAKPPVAPMLVKNAREVPDYEIDPKELDFTNSVNITKGTFRKASWRGTEVAVKELGEDLFTDEDKVWVLRSTL